MCKSLLSLTFSLPLPLTVSALSTGLTQKLQTVTTFGSHQRRKRNKKLNSDNNLHDLPLKIVEDMREVIYRYMAGIATLQQVDVVISALLEDSLFTLNPTDAFRLYSRVSTGVMNSSNSDNRVPDAMSLLPLLATAISDHEECLTQTLHLLHATVNNAGFDYNFSKKYYEYGNAETVSDWVRSLKSSLIRKVISSRDLKKQEITELMLEETRVMTNKKKKGSLRKALLKKAIQDNLKYKKKKEADHWSKKYSPHAQMAATIAKQMYGKNFGRGKTSESRMTKRLFKQGLLLLGFSAQDSENYTKFSTAAHDYFFPEGAGKSGWKKFQSWISGKGSGPKNVEIPKGRAKFNPKDFDDFVSKMPDSFRGPQGPQGPPGPPGPQGPPGGGPQAPPSFMNPVEWTPDVAISIINKLAQLTHAVRPYIDMYQARDLIAVYFTKVYGLPTIEMANVPLPSPDETMNTILTWKNLIPSLQDSAALLSSASSAVSGILGSTNPIIGIVGTSILLNSAQIPERLLASTMEENRRRYQAEFIKESENYAKNPKATSERIDSLQRSINNIDTLMNDETRRQEWSLVPKSILTVKEKERHEKSKVKEHAANALILVATLGTYAAGAVSPPFAAAAVGAGFAATKLKTLTSSISPDTAAGEALKSVVRATIGESLASYIISPAPNEYSISNEMAMVLQKVLKENNMLMSDEPPISNFWDLRLQLMNTPGVDVNYVASKAIEEVHSALTAKYNTQMFRAKIEEDPTWVYTSADKTDNIAFSQFRDRIVADVFPAMSPIHPLIINDKLSPDVELRYSDGSSFMEIIVESTDVEYMTTDKRIAGEILVEKVEDIMQQRQREEEAAALEAEAAEEKSKNIIEETKTIEEANADEKMIAATETETEHKILKDNQDWFYDTNDYLAAIAQESDVVPPKPNIEDYDLSGYNEHWQQKFKKDRTTALEEAEKRALEDLANKNN
jgi:hypothetical protein